MVWRGTSQVTAQSTGGWERWSHFATKPSASCPLAKYRCGDCSSLHPLSRSPALQYQMNSARKMQEFNPSSKELQAKYPGKDLDSRITFEEMRALYKRKKCQRLQPSFLSFGQMPMALFQGRWAVSIPWGGVEFPAFLQVEFIWYWKRNLEGPSVWQW